MINVSQELPVIPTDLPMLRVTVMMFRDMVESVMLLNEDDWTSQQKQGRT